jgi:hypothetical protein
MEDKSFPYALYLFFAVAYLFSFIVMRETKHLQLLGLSIFFFINLIFSTYFAKDILGYLTRPTPITTEASINIVVLIISVAFNITSTIQSIFTMRKLHSSFGKKGIKLDKHDKKKMDNMEIIFICVVCFLGATSLNAFFDPDQLFRTLYEFIRSIVTGPWSVYVKLLFPIICAGIGGRVYDILDNRANCNTEDILNFKKTFKTTYWILFAVILLLLLRIGIDYMFYQKSLRQLVHPIGYRSIPMIFGVDMFLDLAKWALMITGLVYAGFSIREFHKLDSSTPCFKHNLKALYITFITFLMVLFAFTIITPYQLVSLFTFSVRYLVPPTLLGLSAYLVYLTNDLAKLAAKEVIK